MKKVILLICLLSTVLSCKQNLSVKDITKDKNYKTILKLLKNNDLAGIQKIFEKTKQYLPVQNMDNQNMTPFLLAVVKDESSYAKFFLEIGAQINEKLTNGDNAIMIACKTNSEKVLPILLQDKNLGYYLNEKDALGRSTLMNVTSIINNPDLFKSLLIKSNITIQDAEGKTILAYLAKNELLVNSLENLFDANDTNFIQTVNTVDNYGNLSIIDFLVNTPNITAISMVATNTKDINRKNVQGKTPLMFASQVNNNVNVVKLLIHLGAEVTEKENNEWTSSMYAIRYNSNPLVFRELFLKNPSVWSNSAGLNLVMLASCNDNLIILQELLKFKPDINAKTVTGKTALMYAIENNVDIKIIELLMKAGADIDAKDNSDKTISDYLKSNSSLKNIVLTNIKETP